MIIKDYLDGLKENTLIYVMEKDYLFDRFYSKSGPNKSWILYEEVYKLRPIEEMNEMAMVIELTIRS